MGGGTSLPSQQGYGLPHVFFFFFFFLSNTLLRSEKIPNRIRIRLNALLEARGGSGSGSGLMSLLLDTVFHECAALGRSGSGLMSHWTQFFTEFFL